MEENKNEKKGFKVTKDDILVIGAAFVAGGIATMIGFKCGRKYEATLLNAGIGMLVNADPSLGTHIDSAMELAKKNLS